MVKILYSPRETTLLLSLIRKHEVAIYNKRTDTRSNQKKDAAWEAVTEKFNASANVTKRTKMQLRKKWENLRTEYKRQLKKAKVTKMNVPIEPHFESADEVDDTVITSSPEHGEVLNDSEASTFEPVEEEESCEFTASYSTVGYASSFGNIHEHSESEEMATTTYFPISKAQLQPVAFRTGVPHPDAMSVTSMEIKKSKTMSLDEFRLRQEEELHELRKKKLLLKIKVLEEELELKKFQRGKVGHGQKTVGGPEFVDIGEVYPQ